METLQKELSSLLQQALGESSLSLSTEEIGSCFEIPKEEKFGDLSTHVAMKAAKTLKTSPKILGESLKTRLEAALPGSSLQGRISKIVLEGPGFINFYFSQEEIASVLSRVRREGDHFGKPSLKSKNILLEFVSANPTGPLTVAHGRQAALGDCLAKILRFCGHRVTTEYYNNDEGVQIQTLGKSLAFRVEEIRSGKKEEMPENFYRGDYLIEIANAYVQRYEKKEGAVFSDYAKDTIMEGIRKDLADFDVTFDGFYSQKALGASGKVEQTLQELKSKGVVYESEGATWLRSTSFGDDKDRVLVKSDGSYTYLTPDIAYHHHKFARGFDTLINILGPDHHGYIARLKASQQALGHDSSRMHILIAQLVTLYEGTKQVRMSTRAGEFVTLRQILDEVGKDAGRFFFLMRKFDAHLDFDLALAKSQTPDNPVFYIQYAHARIESVKNAYAPGGNIEALPWEDPQALKRLSSPSEWRLLRLLSQYELHVAGAERTLEPYRIVAYLMELAGAFHRFYAENRVVSDDAELTRARLALILGTQTVLRSGLGLLGVSAPLKM